METLNENQISEIKGESGKTKDDEISLIDLFAVLLKYKKMEIVIVAAAMIFAVIFSVISIKLPPEKSFLPNEYTSTANMLINDSSSSGGSLSSMLSSSGLGSLMGVSAGGGATYSSLAVYLVSSNPLADAIVENFNILDREEFEKSKFPVSDSRKWVSEKLKSNLDDDSGVFSISFTDIDPTFAQLVVNFAVDWLSNRFDELGIDKNKIQKANLEKNIESSFAEIQRLQKEVENVGYSVVSGSSVYLSLIHI